MSDRPRYTMRQGGYMKGTRTAFVYAMILDTWYCYREVWRVDIHVGWNAERTVNALAVERLAELEAEHEAWIAAA